MDISSDEYSSEEELMIESPERKQQINVTLIAKLVKGQKAIIFCRVSSFGQVGPWSISFEVQEQKGMACARVFGLKVFSVVKVVESAFRGKACTIKSLIYKSRNKNIIIYDVSRFCRDVVHGRELLAYANKYNVRLFFVEEGIVWDREHQGSRDALLQKLRMAEAESAAISRRVTHAKALKKARGFFMGGTPKYGFKVIEVEGGKRAVADAPEQAVIKFIDLCKTTGTTARTLNQWMQQISPNFDSPITLYHGDKVVRSLQEPLSYNDIAHLLNDYEVLKRGSTWNSGMVGSIAKRQYENVLEGMVALSM